MDTIETLSKRNTHFAARQFTRGLAMMPNLKTMVVGCADPRVDPPMCSAWNSATQS